MIFRSYNKNPNSANNIQSAEAYFKFHSNNELQINGIVYNGNVFAIQWNNPVSCNDNNESATNNFQSFEF